jgi:hypothetical protein
VIERRNGTYCAATYNDATSRSLEAWLLSNLIPNPVKADKIHSTIIYSRALITETAWLSNFNYQCIFWPMSIDLIEGNILRLLINAPELHEIHYGLLSVGGTHPFDEFVPHITLSYDVGDFDCSNLKVPEIPLLVGKIYTEPLNVNWNP